MPSVSVESVIEGLAKSTRRILLALTLANSNPLALVFEPSKTSAEYFAETPVNVFTPISKP